MDNTLTTQITRAELDELQKQAATVVQADEELQKVKELYAHTGQSAAEKTAKFAKTVYAFLLKHQRNEQIVADKLISLGVRIKKTTPYATHVAHLAFFDEEKEQQKTDKSYASNYSRWGGMLHNAYISKIDQKTFNNKVENGFRSAYDYFEKIAHGEQNTNVSHRAQIGLDLIQKRINVPNLAIEANTTAQEGELVELVAEVVNGKLMLRGVLDKSQKNIQDDLEKEYRKDKENKITALKLFQEYKRFHGLLGKGAIVHLNTNGQVHLHAQTSTGAIEIISENELTNFSASQFAISADHFHQICTNLTQVFKRFDDISFAVGDKEINVTSATLDIADLGNRKPVGVGDYQQKDETKAFEHGKVATYRYIQEPYSEVKSFENAVADAQLNAENFETLFQKSVGKKKIALSFDNGVVGLNGEKIIETSGKGKAGLEITSKFFGALKKAHKALARFSDKISLEILQGGLRLTAFDNDMTYVVYVEAI